MGFFDLFRKTERYNPTLIDLPAYEAALNRNKAQSKPAIPVRPIPFSATDYWTAAEMQAMRENRAEAEKIKARIYGER